MYPVSLNKSHEDDEDYLFDRETRSIAVLEVLKLLLLLLLGQTLIKKLQKVFLIVIIRSATGKQFLLQSF